MSETMNGTATTGYLNTLPYIFEEIKTAETYDVLEVGWLVAFGVIYFSLLLFVPAMECKEKAIYFTRMSLTVFLGYIVIACNFGQEWEVGQIQSKMFYKAGSHQEINASVGIKLGLRSVNITLKALENPHGDLSKEKIDYNERFYWTWEQGRAGFGPFAGQIQRDFRAAQNRGLPYPILWVAEYFTFDGEGFRFGRRYRHAGWFSHICIWTAFPVWILTIVMFKLVIRYGALMLSLLGCLLITSALIWCSVRNYNELAVIFNDNELTGVLKTHYGIHWYLALIVGSCCLAVGILLLILDEQFHSALCKFFGLNPLAILDECYEDVDEVEEPSTKIIEPDVEAIEMQIPKKNKISRQKSKVVFRARGTKKKFKTTSLSDNTYENTVATDQQYSSNKLHPYHAGQIVGLSDGMPQSTSYNDGGLNQNQGQEFGNDGYAQENVYTEDKSY